MRVYCEYFEKNLLGTLWSNQWVLFERTLSKWLRIHTGHIGIKIVKEPCGSIQKVPTGYFGGHFSKELTTYLLGNNQVNCFRTYKELTVDPLGNFPLAPSGKELTGQTKMAKGSEEQIPQGSPPMHG